MRIGLLFRLAFIELVSRYKGAFLGPLWIWISFLCRVIAIAIVYSSVFEQPVDEYIVFLVVGISLWNFLSGVIGSSASSLTRSKAYLLQFSDISWDFFLLKDFIKEFLQFCLVFFPLFFVFCSLGLISLSGLGFWFWIGLLLSSLVVFQVSVVVAFLSARYRDFAHLVPPVLQVAFLVTPVLWQSSLLASGSPALKYNPFYYLLEGVRAPILTGQKFAGYDSLFLFFFLVVSLVALLVWFYHKDTYRAML